MIFEGEYLIGKKWKGIIKEYYNKNKLKYESEYSNGLLNGNGKEYHNNDKIFFEGEYLNGKKWNGNIYTSYAPRSSQKFKIKNGSAEFLESFYNE